MSRLGRPKFDRYREPASWNSFLAALVELALWHEDVDDDKFLALDVTGQADAIISGDRDLLDLVSHDGIPILTPAQFLQRVREPEA